MADRYAGMGDDLLSSASYAAAVTPSDIEQLPYASKRLWIGGAGNVTVITVGGQTVEYAGVPAGTYLPVRVVQVMATGTTADIPIVAEY